MQPVPKALPRSARAACRPTLGLFLLPLVLACAPAVRQAPKSQAPPAASLVGSGPSAAALDPANVAEVEKWVSAHIAARGGLDKLEALTSLRLTGTLEFRAGDFALKTDHGMVIDRAGRLRVEDTYQGLTAVDAYDGKEMWSLDPFEGRRDAFRRSADDAKPFARLADLDGPLVDWQKKGHRVEYLGTEEIDGSQAHKLRVSYKDGTVEYRYLEAETLLEMRVVSIDKVRGTDKVTETNVGEYAEVAGVWIPLAIDTEEKGTGRRIHISFDHAEPNLAFDARLFSFSPPGTKIERTILATGAPVSDAVAPASQAATREVQFDASLLSGLGARNIGSAAMSGRIAALDAYVENGKTTIYVGSASGGVWKSKDGGTTFKPVFDKQPVQSIGAVTIDPGRRDTVWVGTGEAWTRNTVSVGDGIYKSTDGGATWKNQGLVGTERIVRILVDPRNSNIVYACAPGPLWSDSTERGVYKTSDGGKSWALVLKGANLSTGCSGLTLDPRYPDVLFAGMWDFRRSAWSFRSGGEGPTAASGSGLFRSADGGKTWRALTREKHKGLPAGPWGRVDVVVAPSDSKTVYALIESTDSALYASADGGITWEQRDKSRNMVWRPFYFARLVVDPHEPNRIFKPNLRLIASEDGGRSFAETSGQAHGDWHDLWIDPTNTQHIVGGDDGGLWTSYDGGSRWWKSDNLPLSQFYHVSVDNKDPYQVYGGLQDNSSWVGVSAYPGGIDNARWENLYNSDGFWVLVDPTDPEAVYAEAQGGYVVRIDRRTRIARDIQPKAQYKEKLRFNWNTPIHVSAVNKNSLYIGAQFLFRSKDRGDSWERISPDLTTNDPAKQKQELSGGITVDNSSAEMHTTIYSISESPRDPRTIWVGTDDGNVQLTRNAGKSWKNLVANVPALPKASWVSWVEASRYNTGTAYACFDRHTAGDMTPWVYKTTDFGESWTRIVSPASGVRGYVHVIKEDRVKPEILFLGTELGLWVSLDAGAHWAEFKGGDFPAVAVRDLQIQPKKDDLVIATHGRGIWIIDDLEPLRQLDPRKLNQTAVLLPGRAPEQRMRGQEGWMPGDAAFMGENPASGAVITYYQRARHTYGRLKLEVLDSQGKLVETLNPGKRRGINRVVWPMRVKPPRVPRAAQIAFNASQSPHVLPGEYTVRLSKGAEVFETKLKVGLDPRVAYSKADRKKQYDAAMRIQALFGQTSDLVDRLDLAVGACRARASALASGDPLSAALGKLEAKLHDLKKQIVATKEGGAITGEERIREHLDSIYGAVNSWEGRPARYQLARIDTLARELSDVEKAFQAIVAEDILRIDRELGTRKLEPISTRAEAALVPERRQALRDLRCRRLGGRCSAASAEAAVTRSE